MSIARFSLALALILGSVCCAANAATYVKVADEWGTIQPAGPRSTSGGIRGWNIEGGNLGANASSGTLRFYMSDLVTSLNAAFPSGWQVNKATLVAEHDDAGFSAAGNVSIFHFTNDALKITSGTSTASLGDVAPNDFTALGISELIYSDAATVGGQPVRVELNASVGGGAPDMGTVTKINDYVFSYNGTAQDGNLDVFGDPANLVDPAGATNATPDYALSFPTVNVDDTLATFTTEVAADQGDWSAGGQNTIIADIQSGTDALSFIFAPTDAASSVAATYKGGPFGTLYPPRIYLDVTASTPAGVAGDYNNNGKVDAADYVVWKNGGPLQNEVSGTTPGTVTVEDYDAWRARFGNPPGSGAAVPEPASAVLLLLGIASLAARRRVA